MSIPSEGRGARRLFAAAAVWVGAGVAFGAFGAHLLAERIPEWYPEAELAARRSMNWETGAHYQMLHGLGALIAALACGHARRPQLSLIGGVMLLLGNLVFSGSLYLLVVTGATWWGAIVPLGGLSQLLGWFVVAGCGPNFLPRSER